MTPIDPNLNALWCRAITEELQRAGVVRAVCCPGSRNAPLLFALATAFPGRVLVHVDERSAGFIALGMARAAGAPVVVCVTSGSAVANLHPAFVEAEHAGVPLIALTADRPWEAQAIAAPQTMDQRAIFGASALRVDLGEPFAESRCLRALRSRVSRAVQSGRPVQLNVPLRDPLPPLADPAWSRPALPALELHGRDGAPWIRIAGGDDLGAAQALLRPGRRGMIVVGPDCPLGHGEVALLASRTGFPVAADAPSGLRRPMVPHLLPSFDALCGVAGLVKPDLVLRLGAAPTSRTAYEWLDGLDADQIAITADAQEHDFLLRCRVQLVRPSRSAIEELADRLAPGDATFRHRWEAAEVHVRAGLRQWLATCPWGEHLAVHLALEHPGFARVHVASSLSIRLVNLLAGSWPAEQTITANRGVNGIDGTLATFLGSAHAAGGVNLLIAGDLAFLHDLPALAAARGVRGAILLLNNGGGALFDLLPVAAVPGFRELVRADHAQTFGHAAALFGLAYHGVREADGLHTALEAAAVGDRLHLIECDVHGADAAGRQRELITTLHAAIPRNNP